MQTQRCNLRLATLNDSKFLLSLFRNPEVVENISGIRYINKTISNVDKLIQTLNFPTDTSEGLIWIIELVQYAIGFIMIYDLSNRPFISYALLPQYRREGYMYECLMAIGNFMKDRITDKISIEADYSNISSIKLKCKILATPEGENIFI